MHITCAQVQADFIDKLMFGGTRQKKMSTCWNNSFEGVEVPKVFTEQIMYKAVEIAN